MSPHGFCISLSISDPRSRAAAVLGEVCNEGPSHRIPKEAIKKDCRSSCLTEDANISNGVNEEQAEAAGGANRLQTCMQPDDGGGEGEENKTEEGDRSVSFTLLPHTTKKFGTTLYVITIFNFRMFSVQCTKTSLGILMSLPYFY